MTTPRERENVLAVYVDEGEAVKHAVMLASELGRAVDVVYRPSIGAEVYRIVVAGFSAEGWQRVGSADPTRGYHGWAAR